ncbi:OmpA family protein [Aquitalea magnusonii]|nr:OmpA family protein [Aquitalea magnusonii]
MPPLLWYWLYPLIMLSLGLLLIWRALPVSTAVAMLLSLPWLIGMLALWRRLRQQASHSATEVILLGGPAAHALQQAQGWRSTLQPAWHWLDQPQQLAAWHSSGIRARGLLLVINADVFNPTPAAVSQLADWYHAWQLAQQQHGHPLPGALLILATHPALEQALPLPVAIAPTRNYPAAQHAIAQQIQAVLAAALQAAPDKSLAALQHAVVLNTLQQHVSQQLLPALLPEQAGKQAPALHALACLSQPAGEPGPKEVPWQDAANRHSGLQAPATTPCGLPTDSTVLTMLTDCFPPIRACPPGWRQLATLISSSALFLMAFISCSAWNNQQLITQTAVRLHAFQALAATQEPARGVAAQQLQAWQRQLSTLAADGIPLKLGFALYQGQALADLSLRAVQSYHPPQPKPEVVRLDSTALFDSGQSVLKPEAKLALQAVLVWVQANPGKRVLIDGHTDNTGSRAANLRLSLMRAEAVRQWLVTASTFPITHFAVQGLADTQPLYGNDDASGRSKNRRVEITLIEPPAGR